MSTSKFFAGVIVGAVAGLLLAPQKGEDLRNDIADSAEKWKKKFYRISGQTVAEMEDLRDMLEDEVAGLSDDIRFRLLTILDETESSASKMKSAVTSELS